MLGLFAKFGLLFVRPKTAPYLWGALIAVALVSYGFWSWTTVQRLRQEKVEMALQYENDALEYSNNQLILDQQSTERRMDQLVNSLENLNSSFGRNYQQRQDTIDDISTDIPSGQAPDTLVMQERANQGMNQLFTDLEMISGRTE